MKLYATVHGVREVNGINTLVQSAQGSNKKIVAEFTVDREIVLTVELVATDNAAGYELSVKGEKQKGECSGCGSKLDEGYFCHNQRCTVVRD